MDRSTNYIKSLIVLFIIFNSSDLMGQTDHVLWSSVQLQKELSKKSSLSLKPIVRFDNDISQYQNTSIEVAYKYKFAKGWSAQLLERTWLIPDGGNRQFIWSDLAYSSTIKNIQITNRIRHHWALNINDRNDPDFLRYHLKFQFLSSKKISPYVGIEPWFRLNRINQWQRYRFEPGINWQINTIYALNFQYRIEESINLKPKVNVNFLVVNLLIKI